MKASSLQESLNNSFSLSLSFKQLRGLGLYRNPYFSNRRRKTFSCPKSQDVVVKFGPWPGSASITWEFGTHPRLPEAETHN